MTAKYPLCLKCLIVSGIVLFISIICISPKIMALGFIQFIAAVSWNTKEIMLKNTSLAEFSEYNNEQAMKSFNEGNRFTGSVYFIVGPMMIVGAIAVLGILWCLLFIM